MTSPAPGYPYLSSSDPPTLLHLGELNLQIKWITGFSELMAIVAMAVAFPPSFSLQLNNTWRRNPILKPSRKPNLKVSAVADPFVLELAEKLEDSVTSIDAKSKRLYNLREKCTQDVLARRWPTSKDEPFRFTDLKFMKEFKISVTEPSNSRLQLTDFEGDLRISGAQRLVFLDGVLEASLSQTAGLPVGVFTGSLSSLPEGIALPEFENPTDGDVFSSLNGIGTRDVGVVVVPKGCKVEKPLHIVYYSVQGGEDLELLWVSNPRLVVALGKGAELEVVEEFRGKGKKSYWTNSVLHVSLEENAKLWHSFVQLQRPGAVHMKSTFVQQGPSSSYNLVETSTGGRLNRHNLRIQQLGPDTVTEVSTFHLAREHQTQDLHSKFILNHPRGYSRQLHKCIVTHSSGHAVFDGNVQVNRNAQLTDAGQLSRSLLLAPRATVNVKPNLQIVADDVKCSHGAAISDLEDDQLFYFQARGVDAQTARNALVFSFGAEVMERIPNKDLRKRVENDVRELLAAEGAIH